MTSRAFKPARRKRRAQSLVGAVLVGVALMALAGLALAGFLLRAPPTDAETLCRTDQPPAAHTIILVDATDKLEPRHRRRLRAVAAQERARLNQGDRFTLMRINARHPNEPAILFSKCLPKPPERTNPLFENPRLAQQHWDEAFEQGLQAALRGAQASGRQNASPIIAGLRAAATDPDFAPQSARRLVLISDLLEHNPRGFSLYDPHASYEAWRASDPRGAPDLEGVDVRLVRLDRPDQIEAQTAARTFWDRFFEDASPHDLDIDAAP